MNLAQLERDLASLRGLATGQLHRLAPAAALDLVALQVELMARKLEEGVYGRTGPVPVGGALEALAGARGLVDADEGGA